MNSRIPLTPPVIKSLDPLSDRPLWSVMIPAFNCSRFLIQTIKAVLTQDPGTNLMQIEVVDDHSTDANLAAVVASLGKGRVSYFRQPQNVGSLRNFETCLNRAKGHWVHILHGDDLVKPGFYKEIEQLFRRFPEAGAAFTAHINIDEQGNERERSRTFSAQPALLSNWLDTIARAQRIQPPSIVVKRTVYEQLGSFYAAHYGEDWEMWVRIAAHFPVAYSPRHLGLYRLHNGNITSRSLLNGQSIQDIYTVIRLNETHVPREKRKEITAFARKHSSKYFAHASDRVYHQLHNPRKALELSLMARKMDRNLVTSFFVIKNHLKILLRYKYKHLTTQNQPPAASVSKQAYAPVVALPSKKDDPPKKTGSMK